MRTKTYNFREFVRNEHRRVKQPTVSLVPLAAAPLMPTTVLAEPSIEAKMMDAFMPLVDLAQAMAYPVALICVIGGAAYIMFGNAEKGFSMMQKAGIGYVIVMVAPLIFSVLADAVSGVTA